jgi:hypothetical protein
LETRKEPGGSGLADKCGNVNSPLAILKDQDIAVSIVERRRDLLLTIPVFLLSGRGCGSSSKPPAVR